MGGKPVQQSTGRTVRSAVKRLVRQLARHNYDLARAYHQMLVRRSFVADEPPLFIYQMGKVGSRSLWASLRASPLRMPIWHVHYLSDEILARLERTYRRSWPEGNATHLWQCEYLRKQVDRGLENMKVITLTRDPIARNISSFFQCLEIRPADRGAGHVIKSTDYDFEVTLTDGNVEPLVSLFFEKFDHDTPLVFFDREIRDVLGIDVYRTEFHPSRGYQIYGGSRADLLVIKLERLNDCAAEAMHAFLGLEDFELVTTNVGRDQEHGFIYDMLKDAIRVPDSYIEEMYGSRYARHFYTEAELEGFERRWRHGARKRRDRDAPVVVVSGLPRSGTSMMMKVLEAAGIESATDGIREADVDNPKGYYELERVKRLRDGDTAWLAETRGKAVKVISELLKWLPAEHEYRVVFMRRDMDEILASQRDMLARRGIDPDADQDARLRGLYSRHLEEVDAWLARQPNVRALYVDYADLLSDPRSGLERVNRFLGGGLDSDRMAAAIDPSLYRHRGGERGATSGSVSPGAG